VCARRVELVGKDEGVTTTAAGALVGVLGRD